jgi:hypothetical protein
VTMMSGMIQHRQLQFLPCTLISHYSISTSLPFTNLSSSSFNPPGPFQSHPSHFYFIKSSSFSFFLSFFLSFLFCFFCFLFFVFGVGQMVDMSGSKHMTQLTTWQVFSSGREEVSKPGIELPTSSLKFGYLSTTIW